MSSESSEPPAASGTSETQESQSSASALGQSFTVPGAVARLTRIEIDNYRGFRGRFELDLGAGENLILFGENGVGKSSFFRAIADFLESPDTWLFDPKTRVRRTLKPEDNRHRFSNEPAAVRLVFAKPSVGGAGTSSKVYEWSGTKNDPATADMRTVDKGKGCLDYRALLRVHLLPSGQREIDLFPIFLNPILAHARNPVSTPSMTFLEEWKQINTAFAPYSRRPPRLDESLSQFNAGFERIVGDTLSMASELLRGFDEELKVEAAFTPASYVWRPKLLTPPKIVAKSVFRRLQHSDYFDSLNEARLSALAVALYLAGLKVSAAGDSRLLVLDDVLIGLDMANRAKVLDLVHSNFRDWQIFILTYSKSWFERLKERVKPLPWRASWKAVILREEWAGGEISPRVVAEDSGDSIETARRHLVRKDFTAAAIYVRTALERVCHSECARVGLRLTYVESQKDRKLDHYIQALENRLGQLVDEAKRQRALTLVLRLREARAFVLNREAHFDVEDEDTLSAEVSDAINAVEDFSGFLTETLGKKSEFREGLQLRPAELAKADLAEASRLAERGMQAESLKKLSAAHGIAWEAFGAQRGVSLSMGVRPLPAEVWKAASQQGLLDSTLNERLKAARPYLFGSVDLRDYSTDEFTVAARLVGELMAAPVPGPTGNL